MHNAPDSVNVVDIHRTIVRTALPLPCMLTTISAGFPSPADDYLDKQLDLNEWLIKHPAATFFIRVEGDSMRNAGITSGDVLIVDRALEPSNGKIIVAVVDGEFTVKRIAIGAEGIRLMPANDSYPPIVINPESDFRIWGVVTYVIHRAS